MTSFNYEKRLENNKNESVKYLIKKLQEEGINRAPNSKNKMGYTSIKNLSLSDLAKVLTDVQEKKEKGLKNKIDRLAVENWGSKDIFIKYITKNNLYKGTKTSLINLKSDKLKDIILKEHVGLSPRKSPVSSSPARISPKTSPKYEIDPITNKKRKSCKKNQIRNPKTGRCIINKSYKTSISSSLKKNGMVTCNKCGSLILKIKLKKHQESNKCKKSPKSSNSNTPIKRKRKRKIIDDDTDDENVISSPKSAQSSLSPIIKRKIIDYDTDDENVISSPKSVFSNQSTLSPIIRRKRKNIIIDESESEEENEVENEEENEADKEEEENVEEENEEEEENEADKEEENEADKEENEVEENEEDEDMYISNADKDDDDDLYVSEKSLLEEGDEVDEAEEIDDLNDIDSKLNEINNIVLKDDKIIKNKILQHLGLL